MLLSGLRWTSLQSARCGTRRIAKCKNPFSVRAQGESPSQGKTCIAAHCYELVALSPLFSNSLVVKARCLRTSYEEQRGVVDGKLTFAASAMSMAAPAVSLIFTLVIPPFSFAASTAVGVPLS